MSTSRSLVWAKFGLLFFLVGLLGVAVSTHLPTTGAAAPSAPPASVYFSNPVTYTTGGQAPSGVAVGDFDGDGKLDMAVTNNSSGTVGILKGNGDGTFQPAITFPTGSSPFGAWTADLNNDGKLDLVIARQSNNVIDVMLGNGDGTFQSYFTYGTGPGVIQVKVADFNNDGKPDIATANDGSTTTVSVLFGNGDGTFQPANNWSTGSSNVGNLTVGDFNGDNKLDIAVSTDSAVSALINDGNGGFPTYHSYSTGIRPNSIFTADLNGDGKLDLIAGFASVYHAFIFLGNGDGTFQPQNAAFTDYSFHPITVGDFNGDGKADYVWIDTPNKQIQVYGGNGDGTFQLIFSCNLSVAPYNLAMGDFNGDGKLDAITINQANNNISVFLNSNPSLSISDTSVVEGNSGTTSAVFTATLSSSCCVTTTVNYATADGTATVADNDYVPISGTITFAPGETSKTITVTVNGDTKVEPNETFTVNLSSSSGAVISKSVGTGTIINDDFPPPPPVNFTGPVNYATGGNFPQVVAKGDFNGDGKLDLAVGNTNSGTIGLLLGNGDGTFQPARLVNAGNGVFGVTAADLDGDGKLDLIATTLYNNQMNILYGNGDGTFQPLVSYPMTGAGIATIGDFNGDGKLDIACPNYSNNQIAIFLGGGNRTFQNPVFATSGTGSGPNYLVAQDFNGDGKLDLAATNTNGGINTPNSTVSILLGKGDGTFQPAVEYRAGANPASLVAGDFNGDGKLDLVTGISNPNKVFVLLGNGDGTFNPIGIYTPSSVAGHPIAVADFNGDGKADVVWVDYTNTTISILAGNGDGTFQLLYSCTLSVSPSFVLAADFNGDNKPDFVTVNQNSNNLSVFINSNTPSLSISDTSVVEGNSGTTSAVFTATLSGSCCQTITATYATADGTATVADNDYVPISGTITFAPGETSKTITVTVNGDTKVEPNETFKVNLSNSVNATISKSVGIGTIINDDYPPAYPFTFSQPVTYTTGGQAPSGVAVGDFDGDGKLDMAVTNNSSGTVGILKGNGDGTFQSAVTFPTGSSPFGAWTADLNNDGKLDLVIARQSNNVIDVMLGNGDGTFQPYFTYGTGPGVIQVKVADFNGDGKPDIATANDGSTNTVSVLFGNGDGTFQPANNWSTGTYAVGNLTVGDFNGDGKLDIAVSTDSAVSALINDGNGGFPTYHSYSTGIRPNSIFTADLNGDGKLDLIAGFASIYHAFVFLGNGDGTFQPQNAAFTDYSFHPITVGDFNGDGKTDYVWIDTQNKLLQVYAGRGDGTFQLIFSCNLSVAPYNLTLGDFNGDGKLDVATINQANNNLSVFLNSNPPTLSINDTSVVEGNSGTTSAVFTATLSGSCCQTITATYATADGTATVADNDYVPISGTITFAPGETSKTITVTVNGDTKVEPNETFTVNLSSSSGAVISKSVGTGTIINDDFPPPPPVNFTGPVNYATGGNFPQVVAKGDFNGDGKLDLAVGNTNSGTIGLLLGNGDGTFQPARLVNAGSGVFGVTAADLDGDGKLDLIATSFNNNQMNILYGNGDGTFQPLVSYPMAGAGIATVGDFNGDGKLDIACPNYSSNQIAIFLNNGGRTFQNPVFATSGTGSGPNYLVAQDFNGDGKLDLAATNTNGGINTPNSTVSILLGKGDGTFQPAVEYRAGANPASLVAGDFNGDGKLDLVTGISNPNKVFVLLGNGDGTFNPIGIYTPSSVAGHPIAVADFNGDGKADVVWVDYTNTTISILAGNGDGTFQLLYSCTLSVSPSFVLAADLNGDTKPDFVTVNQNSNNLSVFINSNTPTLSISDTSVVEGNSGTTSAVFTATLSGSCCQTITATYATADGTATVADNDYVPISGTITFAPGETSKTITVTVNGDAKYEADETFTVNLSNSVNATISKSVGIGTIINDDGPPALSINDVRQNEGNSGPTPFGFNVTLSSVSGVPVTVSFATADGTATVADNDYVPISGTLTFAPGETSKPLTVTVNGDTKFEPDETFTVTLSSSVNATISKTVGIGTIVNDDAVPCDPAVVTHSLDDGQASTCGTLSYALANATTQTTITFVLSGTNTVTMTGPLTPTVRSEVVIKGGNSCGAPIVINGNGVSGDGLRLSGHDTLINLWIKGFGGRQLVINPPVGGRNVLSCVKASKS